jgi:threonine/homoserine/homoserine lactone efflux protein
MHISPFLKGLLIGFSIAAPVGAIGILCIRRTLAEGTVNGLVSGLGAATADAFYASVAGFGLTFISSQLIRQQLWISLIGGAFLCYLGAKIFFSKPAEQEVISARRMSTLGAYGTTFFLTLTNPMTILPFAAIFASFGMGEAGGGYTAAASLVGGVFLGSALWWVILSTGVGLVRSRLDSRWMIWVNRVSGVIIAIFGLSQLLKIVNR